MHLKAITGGKSYSELSTAARANPTDKALQGKVDTAFRGETLRGLLLNAYAFGTMATIALIAGWIGLGGGLLLVALAGPAAPSVEPAHVMASLAFRAPWTVPSPNRWSGPPPAGTVCR